MAKVRRNPNGCFLCGGPCIPCVDSAGQPYMGCKTCRVSLTPREPTEAERLRAQLAAALKVVEAADRLGTWTDPSSADHSATSMRL